MDKKNLQYFQTRYDVFFGLFIILETKKIMRILMILADPKLFVNYYE